MICGFYILIALSVEIYSNIFYNPQIFLNGENGKQLIRKDVKKIKVKKVYYALFVLVLITLPHPYNLIP